VADPRGIVADLHWGNDRTLTRTQATVSMPLGDAIRQSAAILDVAQCEFWDKDALKAEISSPCVGYSGFS